MFVEYADDVCGCGVARASHSGVDGHGFVFAARSAEVVWSQNTPRPVETP